MKNKLSQMFFMKVLFMGLLVSSVVVLPANTSQQLGNAIKTGDKNFLKKYFLG